MYQKVHIKNIQDRCGLSAYAVRILKADIYKNVEIWHCDNPTKKILNLYTTEMVLWRPTYESSTLNKIYLIHIYSAGENVYYFFISSYILSTFLIHWNLEVAKTEHNNIHTVYIINISRIVIKWDVRPSKDCLQERMKWYYLYPLTVVIQ